MTFLSRLLGRAPALSATQRARLDAWARLQKPASARPAAEARLISADVETTGLDVARDRLIAIGAVAIEGSRVALAGSFQAVLRQPEASSDANILVHRIGGDAQAAGDDPAEALVAFLEFIGRDPLVGFHAAFDDIMLRRAGEATLGMPLRLEWIDLAWLAPAVLGDRHPRARSLDDWCEAIGIENLARHDALADALATAQLWQAVAAAGEQRGLGTIDSLRAAARNQEWLSRQRPI